MSFGKSKHNSKRGRCQKTAALAYDCFNYESIEWLVEAGEELEFRNRNALSCHVGNHLC